MSDNLKISGIYAIRNKINGKVWVGQAKNISNRWNTHRYAFRKGKNSPRFQHAWNKYGEENFEYSVLEECECKKDVLCEREQYWIDFYKSCDDRFGYNIASIANSSLGTKRTEEQRKRIGAAQIGKRVSEETKEKMRKAHLGQFAGEKNPNYGKKASLATKEKMRKAHSGENGSSAKLTWKLVAEIRQRYQKCVLGYMKLAKDYGVSRTVIMRIIHNKIWKTEQPNIETTGD